ncbi:MAG: archease [Rhodospirillales bacterium]|nr:archease [Rhodospirillales bacterium]
MATRNWEHFPHGADIGVRGSGPGLAAAFEEAALALTAVIAKPENIRPGIPVEVTCEAPDVEILLLDWLNALIFEMATRSMLFGKFQVRITGDRLQATAWGEKVDRARHAPAVEVKGATFTELAVRGNDTDGWTAQCVVDV